MIDVRVGDACVCCGPSVGYVEHAIEEGMFRSGETFTYHECERCGSLQIAGVPEDLGAYYDNDRYYSFNPRGKLNWRVLRSAPARAALRLNTVLYNRHGIGQGLPWAREAGLRANDRILDLGCGRGANLVRMHLFGYQHLTGSDPYLDAERDIAPGVHLQKKFHHELTGSYDWVMMHHVFEHVPDPREVLRSCRRLIGDSGRILVRMPIMGQEAWRIYGRDWAQIDPPRHLVVYTRTGLDELARSEGLRVAKMSYDSTEFQFWASERIAAKQPFYRSAGTFSKGQRAYWRAEAKRLNLLLAGDQAVIVLAPT